MNNLNSILIEGNLVRDPLVRSTPRGTHVCTFSLASNRYHKQDAHYEQEVSFFDVETWAKLAEDCGSLGRKGRGVRVVGRLKQNRWTGADGKQHSKIAIVAEHVEFRPDFKKETDAAAAAPAHEGETANPLVFVAEPAQRAAEQGRGGYAAADAGYTTTDIGYTAADVGYAAADAGYTTADVGYTAADSRYPDTDAGYTAADGGDIDNSAFIDEIYGAVTF
jgi:single-strand DNA-binding protein